MSDEMERNIIELVDEDGDIMTLEFLDMVEHKGETYMAFIPAEETDDDTYEVLIFKVETEEDGSESLVALEDDGLEDELFQIISDRVAELDEEDEESE